MKAYVGFVLHAQSETDPNGNDVRINPKFELPNGEVYVGGWCRPQTDGPGLTSGSLIVFANLLLDGGQDSYVYQNLWTKDGSKNGGAIKYDLDWVIANWQGNGCDLWEEIRDANFFWNRMAFAYSLNLAVKFATRVGDSAMAAKYQSAKDAVEATLDGHWTGSFMMECQNRQKDGAVIHSFSSFPGKYSWTDPKVSATIKVFAEAFCLEYPINQAANKAGLPGVLIGRYPGDSYAGGNPWQLLTAVLGELFYKGASELIQPNFELASVARKEWASLFKIPETASNLEFAKASLKAGDAVMFRLYNYVKADDGHIAEQISKTSGAQTSAKDLTWSFANLLTALHYRESHLSSLFETESVEKQTVEKHIFKQESIMGRYVRKLKDRKDASI